MRGKTSRYGLCALLMSFALGANGANLVANGGFETGNFSPEWTLSPGGPFDLVCPAGVFVGAAPCIVNTGQYAMTFGLFGAQDSLSQNIPTVPGQTYRLSFFLANDNSANQNTTTFAVIWDGTTVFSLPSPQPSFPYTQQIIDVVATTSSTPLTFVAQQDPSQWFLDDVSVVPAPTVTKAISPSPVYVNAPAQITITLNNPNAAPVTGVAFTDTYPSNLTNTSSPGAATTCGGTVSAAASGNSVALLGGTIPANASCTVTVNVQSALAGTYVNSTGTITASDAPSFGPATGTLVVLAVPTATKAFSPNPILPTAASVLTITLNNANAQALTGVSFTDTYPANLVNTATPGGATSCGGSVSATAGGNSVALSGATIPASGSCTVTVNVTSAVSGVYVNNTGNISTGAGTIPGAQGTLTVIAPLTVAKSFNPGTIATAGTSLLTITLTNPNATTVVTGVALTDIYPANVTNTAAPGATNTCGGTLTTAPNGNTLQLASGSIAAGSSCAITVNVTSTVPGTYVNSTGTVSTTNAGNAGPATAQLIVSNNPISVAKAFAPGTIAMGGTSVLTITLTNPNASAVTTVAFTDNYPANVTNTATPGVTNSCGGAVTAANNGNSLALSGGTIPASGSCAITVNVTSNVSSSYLNSTGTVSTGNAGNAGPATATLVVLSLPTATKAFSPASIPVNGTSQITVTLTNTNAQAVTAVSFVDTYPAGLVNTGTPGVATTCGGTATAAANGNTLQLSGGTIPPNGSCTVTVNVTSAAGGVYVNNTGSITTSAGTIPSTPGTLTVVSLLTVAKSFNPGTIGTSGTSLLTITLTNPNATTVVTGVAFTDTYPANVTNTATPGATNTCGGTLTTAANGSTLQLAGGTIPAGGSCSISVNVTSAAQGTYLNSTGTVTTTNAGNAGPASATLNVNGTIGVAKSFAPTQISSGGTSLLTITLTNPNGAAVAGVALTDNYPANVSNTVPPGLINTCGGTAIATDNGTSLSLTGGTIPANSSCQLTVFVTSVVVGSYLNSTGTVTTTNSGNAGPATATLGVTTATVPGIVYVPIEPCRIMDTRHATLASGVQGPLMGNVLYSIPGFITAGQNWGNYGGTSASDCGLTNPPGGSIRAVALVATILAPNFDSFLGISDANDLGTVLSQVALNYTRGQGLSTMYLVPQVASNTIYFAMPPQLVAHLIFDIVGYHVLSDATALQCTTVSSSPVSIGTGASGSATSPACTAGYALTSGSCESTPAGLRLTSHEAASGNTTWLCAATNTGGTSASLTVTANCCRVPGR